MAPRGAVSYPGPVSYPIPEVSVFPGAAHFRAWLEENGGTAKELWVGYYKKGVGKVSLSYREAVDEALCFGWIDGITKRISEEVYANRYTPRKAKSNWSAINLKRMDELIAAGRVRPAGMRAFEARRATSGAHRPTELPEHYLARLRADHAAWAWFNQQRPSYRRYAAMWILDAKREETRERRLSELIENSSAGRKVKSLIL